MDKYEDALAKARVEYEKARKQGYTWLMNLLEGMFPEMKESEDERIRKAIMEVLKRVSGATDVLENQGTTFKKAMIWLEKQKDKRELDFAEGKVEGVKQTCQEIKDAMSLFEPKDLTPFEFTFRDYIDSAVRYCLSGEGYQQYIKEWAADLLNLERQKAQQPAEWSEEDEEKLSAVISLMKSSRAVDPFYDKMCLEGWLKSLPLNLKKKNEDVSKLCSNEWSEKDEIMLNAAIEMVENSNTVFCFDVNNCKVSSWLKSLRPPQYCENCKLKRSVENWKPSEEQMSMLLAVINDPNNAGAESCHLMLQSLFADLKKL